MLSSVSLPSQGEPFDAAPFGLLLPEGSGVCWEDPREIHRVVVRFAAPAPPAEQLRLEYWGSRWPEQRPPKDRQPGGGDVGWWELGNWYNGGWRAADADVEVEGEAAVFTFRPVNAREFPGLAGFPACYRYTLKLRVASAGELPRIESIQALTDSTWQAREARLVWARPLSDQARVEVFNGTADAVEAEGLDATRVRLWATTNPDPNTFDRTLVTVEAVQAFTFAADDLADGPLFLPHLGVAVLPGDDPRDYAAVEAAAAVRTGATLYDRIAALPEQTWRSAWEGMPPKRRPIYLPLGLEGGRQRFRLDGDGGVLFRTNNQFLESRPGKDTPRLAQDGACLHFRFGLPEAPVARTIEDASIPIGHSAWEAGGIRVEQTAFATALDGTDAAGPVPAGDTFTVFLARFVLTGPPSPPNPPNSGGAGPASPPNSGGADPASPPNSGGVGPASPPNSGGVGPASPANSGGVGPASPPNSGGVGPASPPNSGEAGLSSPPEFGGVGGANHAVFWIECRAGDAPEPLRVDAEGMLWAGDRLRGQVVAEGAPDAAGGVPAWRWMLAPGESRTAVVKIPYVIITEDGERQALAALDFGREQAAVAGYWRRRLDPAMRLVTPEPMLNEFHRAHAGHLLVNCEREPESDRRFARVGSFGYGAFSNESCMMVVDLDRRGYHQEATDCLEAWLHYQGSVGLPGDFSSQEGILYGAGGYEHGGYNQHHGWVLWCLGEHYRFTRDTDWLRHAASGILAGAEWIVRERRRTADRDGLGRGLLPAGSLEDIGDWWFWLSTNCYTWRGLDAAAWALAQIEHPEAFGLRAEAQDYRDALLRTFRAASRRSPVVRLRDGTAVPKIPSQAHRRGRCFGWICETLEGALHLLISRALDARSPEADRILKDYEDNLYLSNQWGYTVEDFDAHWFGRGGMSMQSCLFFDVEPYLYRDDVKHALRAAFNAMAAGYFPDVRMITEHALPHLGDWRGDHYKSSDEANATGWLRYLFVREEGEELLLGQAVPREWLRPGQRCGVERAGTHFGPMSLVYAGGEDEVTAELDGPCRNPPRRIRLRFREPEGRPLQSVLVNGQPWTDLDGEWANLPGDIGRATVVARWSR